MTIGLAMIELMLLTALLGAVVLLLAVIYTAGRSIVQGNGAGWGCLIASAAALYLVPKYTDLQSTDFVRNLTEVISWIN